MFFQTDINNWHYLRIIDCKISWKTILKLSSFKTNFIIILGTYNRIFAIVQEFPFTHWISKLELHCSLSLYIYKRVDILQKLFVDPSTDRVSKTIEHKRGTLGILPLVLYISIIRSTKRQSNFLVSTATSSLLLLSYSITWSGRYFCDGLWYIWPEIANLHSGAKTISHSI